MSRKFQFLVFGEILWDLLPSGKKPGGAPANFAFHANAIGAEAFVSTKIGDDELGRELGKIFVDHRLSLRFLEVDSVLPTGTVAVHLNEHGQPAYEIVQNVAWDNIEAGESVLQFAHSVDLFYFGSLAARSENNRKTLTALLGALSKECLRVFDLNLRAPFYDRATIEPLLRQTDLFKFNDDELFIVAEMFRDVLPNSLSAQDGIFGDELDKLRADIQDWLLRFMQLFGFDCIVLTVGSKGSFLLDQQEKVSFHAAEAVDIVDTVGAGDAFTAVCAVGILKKRSLDEINEKANQYAAYICSQPGAMPELPAALKNILS